MLAEYYNVEDEAKVRCKTPGCGKLFKAPPFVARHIINKHLGLLKPGQRDELDRIDYFHNFVLDPGQYVAVSCRSSCAEPPRSMVPPTPPMVNPLQARGPGFNGFPPFAGPPPFGGTQQRLSDRLGPRIDMGPMGPPMGPPPPGAGPKRRRIEVPPNAPPPMPPKGMALDPRAGKQASYNDLDSATPSGDLDLDY